MNHFFTQIAHAIAASPLHDGSMFLLGKVPGFPPIIQTVHILGIAAVMGSIVLIDLKVLGAALPSQTTGELIKRLMPWTWYALLVLAISGLVFVSARPTRYFANPVFAIKFSLLLPALLLALGFHLASRHSVNFWDATSGRRVTAKIIAALSLLLWLGVVMAGRWIAYADYLFGG